MNRDAGIRVRFLRQQAEARSVELEAPKAGKGGLVTRNHREILAIRSDGIKSMLDRGE